MVASLLALPYMRPPVEAQVYCAPAEHRRRSHCEPRVRVTTSATPGCKEPRQRASACAQMRRRLASGKAANLSAVAHSTACKDGRRLPGSVAISPCELLDKYAFFHREQCKPLNTHPSIDAAATRKRAALVQKPDKNHAALENKKRGIYGERRQHHIGGWARINWGLSGSSEDVEQHWQRIAISNTAPISAPIQSQAATSISFMKRPRCGLVSESTRNIN